jgi:hypothetical protein
MDEHGSKAAYIGGGLIIALVIIGIVFGIYQVTSGMSRKGTSDLTKMSGTLQESTYTQYDGATVNGDQVIALIKEHQGDEIAIVVDNGNGKVDYIYDGSGADENGKASLTGKTPTPKDKMAKNLHDAATKTASGYIAPTKQFTCTVCRDEKTDAVAAMYFAPAK